MKRNKAIEYNKFDYKECKIQREIARLTIKNKLLFLNATIQMISLLLIENMLYVQYSII